MRIVFVGAGAIGVPVLRMLRQSREDDLVGVVTQPDKPAGRKQKVTPPPVKAAMIDSGIPILQPDKIRLPEALSEIRALAPELIIVMAYGQILPRALLELPKLGCLNLHASLLPRWRGAAPIQAAIAAGDEVTGITVMYMDEGLDTGDILLQRRIALAPDETGGSLHDRLAQLAPETMSEALALLRDGKARRVSQDNAKATYAPKLSRADGRINWSEPAAVIERKVRAFNPWPVAFTMVNGRTLKIFRASIVTGDKEGLIFRARDGLVAALEVQLEGSRRMSAAEFLRGHADLIGKGVTSG